MSDEEKLCKSIEGMGTTFIKLGQFLATRPDIIGEKLSRQLEKLQDRVPPFSNDEAKNILKDAREKALKNINSKKETLDQQIDEEIKKVEKEIDVLKKNAPEKINKIAIETSSEILKKLIGADVNNSSISAIVDDLSKRGGNKYYGN